MSELHEGYQGHEAPRSSTDRAFGVLFGAVFLIVALWPLWSTGRPAWWALALSLVFFVLALAWPNTLDPLNRLWSRFGALLHRIVSPIVLGVMFFGVLLPVGLLMRLTGKNFLRLARKPNADSYWIEREPSRPDHFKNQF